MATQKPTLFILEHSDAMNAFASKIPLGKSTSLFYFVLLPDVEDQPELELLSWAQTLWSLSVSSVLEYSRIIFDIFPTEKLVLQYFCIAYCF